MALLHHPNRWIVVTTINEPTQAISAISELCSSGWSAVVIGDVKTPEPWAARNIHYLTVQRQREIFGSFADAVPYRHYCRKNLGYLFAMQQGAEVILETDDDNLPYPSFGAQLSRQVTGRLVGGTRWANVYKYFTEDLIWPRGMPLNQIHSGGLLGNAVAADSPVQQYLADNDPDVDAIYRLIFRRPVFFSQAAEPVLLEKGTWCPFNSQNTIFFRIAFPLLYLPCNVSFRMTDIWRSFVVQAALWVKDSKISFHQPTVEQIRNEHDLMDDFRDEIVGYTENEKITRILDSARVACNRNDEIATIAERLWRALEASGVIPPDEIPIMQQWFEQCEHILSQRLVGTCSSL